MGQGRPVQVDPMKPKLKPPGTKRLKPKCDILLSTSAFNLNSRRYNKGGVEADPQGVQGGACAEDSPTEPVLTVGPARNRSECFQHICPTAFLELNATLVHRSLFKAGGLLRITTRPTARSP